MKKVAFILQCLTGGGAERTVANLSFELSKNYEVYIILYNGERVTYPHNAKILDIKLPPRKSLFGKIINVFKRINAIKKLKRQYQFDFVVSFMFGANIVNVLSKGNEKIITSARNFLSVYGLSKFKVFREQFIARKSDNIVAISEMVKRDMVANFNLDGEKITTIYNPCDSDRIKSLSKEETDYEFDSNLFYFVNVGRLVHQKGQWNLIKAFKEVVETHPDCRLLILGLGPLEEKLKALVDELNISEKVMFFGFVDNPFSYICRSNVFVLSSLHEGLGNVILEALACGVPVISTDCFAGPREILAPDTSVEGQAVGIEYHKYGVLVPNFDNNENFSNTINNVHKELAQAMIALYENAEKRDYYKSISEERIRDFEPEIIADKWKMVLK